MEFRPLLARDSPIIAELEKKCYSKEFRLGETDFRSDLEAAEVKNGNFSLGVFLNDLLVGYIVAYMDESDQTGDSVVYVSDLAVHPEWQRRDLGTQLAVKFLTSLEGKWIVEGECRAGSFAMVQALSHEFLALGYQLVDSKKLPNYNGGEDYWWVRLEPISKPKGD